MALLGRCKVASAAYIDYRLDKSIDAMKRISRSTHTVTLQINTIKPTFDLMGTLT